MPRFVQISDSVKVPIPGYGAMGLSQGYGKADDSESKKVLQHAIDVGCTFWNTATIYGQEQHNEKLLGEVLRQPGNRQKVFLTTKWGIKYDDEGNMTVDGSAAFAEHCIEQSIRNLGSAPDAWLLHRVDANTPIEESVKAMQKAREEGKTKFIGLSAMSANTLRRAAKVAKIDFVEMEFSPFETAAIEQTGILDACRELGVKIFAYSPLGKGFLTGRFRTWDDVNKEGDMRGGGAFPRYTKENWDTNFKLVEEIEKLAKVKGCSPGNLALAWVMAVHGDIILPIPGTKSIKYLDENFAAADVELTEAEIAGVRRVIVENPLKGDQYGEALSKLLDQS